MKKTPTTNSKGKKKRPKAKLGIPDLEQSETAVLRSLGSPDSRRGYQHAIDEFVAWYCSEPRLAFNKAVVLRYRFHLEERGLAPGTINVRMAAVRRLTFEAADSGLLGAGRGTDEKYPLWEGHFTGEEPGLDGVRFVGKL